MKLIGMYRVGTMVLAGGLVAMTVAAQDAAPSGNLPDAQVESNVLRQLASAPELSTQNIQTETVYGTVTLSGNVHDEALRTKAENLTARAQGVKKVVDELTLGDTPAPQQANAAPAGDPNGPPADGNMAPVDGQQAPPPGQVLMSDGTYGPADGSQQQGAEPAPPQQADNTQPPSNQQAYSAGPNGPPPPPAGRYPMNNGYAPDGPQGPPPVGIGQKEGLQVTVPQTAAIQVRIDRGLDANYVEPGTTFTGTIMNDVVAGGAVAIPRGATVQGTVVAAKKAGTFKGQGNLQLQLTSMTLGGQTYALNTQVWGKEGRDKSAHTVNSALGFGVLGALVGAAAGGGTGAAIGAGVGAGAGVASSASQPIGRAVVAPESVITFNLAAPLAVTTVSQQEMARLSYAAGPNRQPRPMRRYYSPYYGYYYGPAY